MTDDDNDAPDDPDTYFYSVWFTACDQEDVLAQVYRDRNGLFLEVRLRICDPTDPKNDPFTGQDYKRFSKFKLQESSLPMIASVVKQALDTYTRTWPAVLVRDRVEINGRADVLTEKLSRKQWAHIKTFDSKEAVDAYLARIRVRARN